MTGTPVPSTDAYPWRSIVYVRAVFDTGNGQTETYVGSGFVTGRNDVLTAGHMVYSGLYGEAISVEVFPGRSGNFQPYGSYQAQEWSYNAVDTDGDRTINPQESARDVALLSFTMPLGETTGWMGLEPNFLNGTMNVTGYPTRPDLGNAVMVTDSANAIADRSDTVIYNDVIHIGNHDIRSGSSGSPVWYLSDGIPYAAGIVSTTSWAFNIGGAYYDELLYQMAANETLLADYGAINVTSGANDDLLSGTIYNDTINGGAGNDTLSGGDGHDSLIGGLGNDSLEGGRGGDTLAGSAGDTILRGGKGHDLIIGGAGADILYAGLGQDTLTGNAGSDLFVLRGYDPVFPAADIIPILTDFTRGIDKLALEGVTEAQITAALPGQSVVNGALLFSVGGAEITLIGVTGIDRTDFVFEGF
ncbi:MAG: trypsin-like serine protease [Alphaproteobacteria bacterium]|nr:trypsin-like serine protease [Alphaproteobacteria bacterium]